MENLREMIEHGMADEIISFIDQNADPLKTGAFPELFILVKMLIYKACDNYEVSDKTLNQLQDAISKILNP